MTTHVLPTFPNSFVKHSLGWVYIDTNFKSTNAESLVTELGCPWIGWNNAAHFF